MFQLAAIITLGVAFIVYSLHMLYLVQMERNQLKDLQEDIKQLEEFRGEIERGSNDQPKDRDSNSTD